MTSTASVMDLFTLTIENAQRLLLLAVPAMLGALIGRAGIFDDNERAVGSLNVYALYVGFPALVYRGVIDDSFALPSSLGFWLAVPIAHALVVAGLALAGGSRRGTLALVALFGNVAYLGLPLVIGIFGESVAGAASLIVAIHVAISVSIGPFLLRKWAGERTTGSLRKLLMQPLLWAPILGLATRLLPTRARDTAEVIVSPPASSAAPVALFLLGLYVWTRRDMLFGKVAGSTAHIATRMMIVPAVTVAVVVTFVQLDMLEPSMAQIFVVLSGMPAAITTFSIAHDAQIGSEIVAATIVRTTFLALLALPLLAALAAQI